MLPLRPDAAKALIETVEIVEEALGVSIHPQRVRWQGILRPGVKIQISGGGRLDRETLTGLRVGFDVDDVWRLTPFAEVPGCYYPRVLAWGASLPVGQALVPDGVHGPVGGQRHFRTVPRWMIGKIFAQAAAKIREVFHDPR